MAVLRSATMRLGGQFVTTSLTVLIHQSYVHSLDSLETVLCYILWYDDAVVTNTFLMLSDSVAAGGATFGQGTGVVLINSLRCIGNETNLTQCAGAEFVISGCPHSRDIGVTCQVRQCKLFLLLSYKALSLSLEIFLDSLSN